MRRNVTYIIFALGLVSCGETKKEEDPATTDYKKYHALNTQARQLFAALPSLAADSSNPMTAEMIKLGKTLYFDNRLSKDNTQSCNTCHNLNTYGVDNKAFSEGNDGGLGGRNSPTTLNAALHFSQFWDGREPHVEAQAGKPILNPVEMAMPNEKAVVEKLSNISEYKELFAKAFPDQKNPITFANLAKSIGAFERKLITPSKFDEYLSGNNLALNDREKKGLQTFINSGCITCHAGSLLGGGMYQKFGLFGNYWDYTKSGKIDQGRFDVTKNESDKYLFKVPSLRNIEKTAPYFHDGSVSQLGDAIKIMAKTQVNKDLNDNEVKEIIDFLKTLTGEVATELKQ